MFDGGGPSVRGGVVFGGDDDHASSDNVVEQNIIAYGAIYNISGAFSGDLGSGNVARSNCVFGAKVADIAELEGFTVSNNVVADPMFVDRDKRDYRLKAGSPCLPVIGYDTAARLRGP